VRLPSRNAGGDGGPRTCATDAPSLEWFTLSAGAKISMTSGVENMDWIARVLRGLIEFTQAGGEVNLIVNGINVARSLTGMPKQPC